MVPVNALVQDWAEANDLEPTRYQMRMAAPPIPQNPAENPADPTATKNSEVP